MSNVSQKLYMLGLSFIHKCRNESEKIYCVLFGMGLNFTTILKKQMGTAVVPIHPVNCRHSKHKKYIYSLLDDAYLNKSK